MKFVDGTTKFAGLHLIFANVTINGYGQIGNGESDNHGRSANHTILCLNNLLGGWGSRDAMSDSSTSKFSMEETEDAIEALWAQSDDVPDLRAYLAENQHWLPQERRVALLVDQHFRYRTSHYWSTEDYLALVPDHEADDELTLDLIYGECRERIRQGNPPNILELSVRFPHLQQRLEQQLEIANWFENGSESRSAEPGSSVEDTTCEPLVATNSFGDYELYDEIAQGGMGVVYRAEHRKLKRIVALKMIRPERLMRAAELLRFKNETQIIAQLDHPNIIEILNVDQADGIHFFTMRMVEGRDLESRRTEYLDDVRGAARLMRTVSSAIHYAHQHGVLHRDLKPSNVLVDEGGTPFVIDFGLASHIWEPTLAAPHIEFRGTPAYAAPELLHEQSQPASVAADVYGLGAILYVLVTGQPPFTGRNTDEVWAKIRANKPPPPGLLNAHIDPDLEAICLKALEKNPADRYESGEALAVDLERYLAGKPVAARPVGWWQHRGRWLRKHPFGPALGLVAAIVTFSLLAVIMLQSIALHDCKKKSEMLRMESEAYRREKELAEERADRLQAEMTGDKPRPAEIP